MSQPTNNRTAATGKREPATGADKTPQVCHTTWEVYIKEKPQKCSGSFCIIIDQNMMTHLLKVYPQIIPLHKNENIFSLTFTLTFSLSEAPHGSLFFERLIFAIKEARQDEKCLDIDKFCS